MVVRLDNSRFIATLASLSLLFLFFNVREKSIAMNGIQIGCESSFQKEESRSNASSTFHLTNTDRPNIIVDSTANETLPMVNYTENETLPMVDYTKQWCPNATCGFNGRCDLCERRFLIVLASARSASTTLTWMLNRLPGIRMSGEDNNVLMSMRTIEQDTVPKFVYRPYHSFGRNRLPPTSYGCVVQEMFQVITPPANTTQQAQLQDSNTIVGFKTIHYHRDIKGATVEKQQQEIQYRANFLRKYFPCGRFIVNIRSNTTAQYLSRARAPGMRKSKKFASETTVEEETDTLRALAQHLGTDQAILMDSSKWITDMEQLNRLVQWLGFNEACYFTELLALNTKHGYEHTKVRIPFDPACRHELAA